MGYVIGNYTTRVFILFLLPKRNVVRCTNITSICLRLLFPWSQCNNPIREILLDLQTKYRMILMKLNYDYRFHNIMMIFQGQESMIEYNQHIWHTMLYYNSLWWFTENTYIFSKTTVSKNLETPVGGRALQWHHVLTLLEKGRLERLLRDNVNPSSEAIGGRTFWSMVKKRHRCSSRGVLGCIFLFNKPGIT